MNDGLDMWGGVECSVVRVGSGIRNQLNDTGHFHRGDDLDLIAELGIKTIRYPVLWDLAQPTRDRFDWSWLDRRLGRLRELQIDPIAGLVHHGSGPEWTHVLDPEFPALLAIFAAEVARRYPWIHRFTPINEPLTTARISGLYGLWHPHGKIEEMFLRLAAAECLAIARSMKAIRHITAGAQLVQTEDVGRVFATQRLQHQAKYENERRWLALDLLAGKVDHEHPFFYPMLAAGVSAAHLDELAREPCVPNVIGLDYYLTSDRVIDHRTELFSEEEVGGNGRHSYVDIAAARSDVPGEAETGLGPRIAEVWNRYGLPIAVTELHNGCTRDEQVRWLLEGWDTAGMARRRGIDVRAVTSWSLFGAVDWNSMLARNDGYYEPGAFDARSTPPRPTIVAKAIAKLAAGEPFDHPVLDRTGWWRLDKGDEGARPIALAGFGRLLSVMERCCHARRLRVVAASPTQLAEDLFSGKHAWAFVEIHEGRLRTGPVYLLGRYPGGGILSVEVQRLQDDWMSITNAFVDFLVDSTVGNYRLMRCAPANQYELTSKASGPLRLTG